MTTLTTRNEITESKKIICTELVKLQKAIYDEELFQLYKQDEEEDIFFEMYDCLHKAQIEYKSFHKIIRLNHFDIDTYCKALTGKLIELFKTIGATDFIIISHLKLDFFGNRENKYKPLRKSYQKLEKIVGDNTFKEAFVFTIDSLYDLIEILFWTTRCDPSIPEYIFCFDRAEKIQFFLCRYGNLHFTEFNKEIVTKKKLNELGWTIIEGEEFDNFSKDGKIQGRILKF